MYFSVPTWLARIWRGNQRSRPRTGVRPSVEILEDRTAPSVNVLGSFAGPMNYTDGGFPVTPPDTIIAVGPDSVLSAVNSELAIQSKTGTTLVGITPFSSFFGSVQSYGDTFSDPYVLYDDLSQRFYVGVLEITASGNSNFDFAVSRTANPTDFTRSSWTDFTRFTSVTEGGADFADFPKMGWNADAVFVSLNEFPNNNGPVHDLILSIDKSALLAGTALQQNVNYFQTDVQTDLGLGNGDHRILIPARMHGNQPGNLEYFVQQNQDLTFTSQSTVNVVVMQNYLGAAPTFTTTTFSVDPYKDSPGVTQLTSQIDDRMLSADWDNNLLVAAQDIGTVSGTPDNLSRWYEFSTSGPTPTLIQQGTINPGPGIDTSYPAIALNAAGDIALTFIQSGQTSSQDPSVYVTGRTPFDLPGTMQTPVLVQAGVSGAPVGQRGGDYAAAEYDPTDGTFWAANEYNIDAGSTDDWGTYIAHFQITSNPNAQFIANVYERLLDRPPDPGALGWVELLANGVAPSTVIGDIEQSTEYLTDVVTSLYQHYLGRGLDPGAFGWVNLLADGTSIEQVTADIVASPEYYGDKGGSNFGFVNGLYGDILDRNADPGGLNAWLAFLNAGGSRYQAALGFLTSTEYDTDLVAGYGWTPVSGGSGGVGGYYLTYLDRQGDAVGVAGWVSVFQAGVSEQAVLAAIFGSAEGYARWS